MTGRCGRNWSHRSLNRPRAGTIRFPGAVAPADIPALMAQSELFVLPSVYEPHGIVVAEAMAVGTPVIASRDCGAARDLVRNGKTGWLFQSGDTAKLTDVLLAGVKSGSTQTEKRCGCKARFSAWYACYGPLTVIPALAGKIKRGA